MTSSTQYEYSTSTVPGSTVQVQSSSCIRPPFIHVIHVRLRRTATSSCVKRNSSSRLFQIMRNITEISCCDYVCVSPSRERWCVYGLRWRWTVRRVGSITSMRMWVPPPCLWGDRGVSARSGGARRLRVLVFSRGGRRAISGPLVVSHRA